MADRPLRATMPVGARRMPQAATQVRYLLIGMAIIGLSLVGGIASDTRIKVILCLVGYLVIAQLLDWGAKYLPSGAHDYLQMIVGTSSLGIATTLLGKNGALTLMVYPTVAVFYTFLGGRRLGFAASFSGVVAAGIARIFGTPISGYQFAIFVMAQAATQLVAVQMISEHRSVTDQLSQLRGALRQVSELPELEPTLEAITAAVARNPRYTHACILLQEEDHLLIAAPAALREQQSEQLVEVISARELNNRKSPLAQAMAQPSGTPSVVIRSNREDSWVSAVLGEPFRSAPQIMLIPLRVTRHRNALLAIACARDDEFEDGERALLEIYAEQAGIGIVRAEAYEALQAAIEEREEADRLKSEFLSMVSHELRSPLSSVKGWVATTRRHWDKFDDEKRLELLARAEANADELTRLIDQLLDFSRIEADRFALLPERFLVTDLVAEVSRDLNPVLEGHSIICDIPPESTVYADRHAVRHVLVNLLSNAVKYSGDSSAISIRVTSDLDWTTVSVIDHGIGISQEDQIRIFDRFVQLSTVPHQARRGTGIGLAIAKRFTEAHGGTIWVTSRVGIGSVFNFTIPTAEREAGEMKRVSE